jgi:hypothetical protein
MPVRLFSDGILAADNTQYYCNHSYYQQYMNDGASVKNEKAK